MAASALLSAACSGSNAGQAQDAGAGGPDGVASSDAGAGGPDGVTSSDAAPAPDAPASEAGGPAVLARNEQKPGCLAIDATNVYWFDESLGIRRVAKSGGQPITLLALGPVLAMAVDAQNLYWTGDLPPGDAWVSNVVMQMPVTGGSPVTLATPAAPTNIAVGGGRVYWTNSIPGTPTDVVESVPIGGGAVTSVATGSDGAGGIATDANYVYWSTPSATYRAALSGGQPQSIGPGADWLAVDASGVYLAQNVQGPSGYPQGSVSVLPLAGGGATVLASGRTGGVGPIALDDAAVYWVEGQGVPGSQGAVARLPKSGGGPTLLAANLDEAYRLAVDETSVYYTDPLQGTVMKVAK
jgi:hypothetical protein